MTSLQLLLLTDEKPGHRSQLDGLAAAIARRTSIETTCLTVGPFGAIDSFDFVPDAVIGAGSQTHLGLWRVARRFRVPSIVLMRPSLPGLRFDLAIVPKHDGVPESRNVWTTTGVLNNVTPPSRMRPRAGGLILLGGPSKHHRWDEERVFCNLLGIMHEDDAHWTITTSRRTPERTLNRLEMSLANQQRATFLPHKKTPRGWLANQLLEANDAIVTEDSVSMISEAITAGCRTSILSLPRHRESRITRYVDSLLEAGAACPVSKRRSFTPSIRLAEADRIADRLLETWWPEHIGARAA